VPSWGGIKEEIKRGKRTDRGKVQADAAADVKTGDARYRAANADGIF
jgi:hypothetical protein